MRTGNLAGNEVGAVAVIVGSIAICFEPMGGEMAKIDEKIEFAWVSAVWPKGSIVICRGFDLLLDGTRRQQFFDLICQLVKITRLCEHDIAAHYMLVVGLDIL